MWPVSQRFLDALTASHEVVSEVDVWRGGVLLAENIPVQSGTVSIDESSNVRRTLDLELADPSLNPADANALLAPMGTELRVRSGIKYPEGDSELVPVGVFGVDAVSRAGMMEAPQVKASDRARKVAEYRLLIPLKIAADRSVVEYIASIVRYADNTWDVVDLSGVDDYTTAVTVESERWDAIELLAKSIGCEVFFDADGACVIRQVPADLTVDPVWTLTPGDGGTLGNYSAEITREGVYNGVVVTGEATEDAPAPTCFLYQKTGPFRWGGPFGKVPRFYSSPLLRTDRACRLAADSLLHRSTGMAQKVIPTAIRNPALDVGDLIEVRLPDGTTQRQIVSKLSFTLGPDEPAMTVETRTSADPQEADDVGGM